MLASALSDGGCEGSPIMRLVSARMAAMLGRDAASLRSMRSIKDSMARDAAGAPFLTDGAGVAR